MGLPWVRLDTQFNTNPKVLYLVEDKAWRALTVYVCALSYCGAHGTDGYIPAAALPFVHARKADADSLVAVGLWHTVPGGWQVNDWADYQQSDDETKARKESLSLGAIKGNCIRWHGPECGCWAREWKAE